MKAAEALIAYTPRREPFMDHPTCGQIRVGPLIGLDDPDWTKGFAYTSGAAYARVQEAEGWLAVGLLFMEFHGIIVRDRLDPLVVHAAFLTIDEYRHRIAPDIDGAECSDGSTLDAVQFWMPSTR